VSSAHLREQAGPKDGALQAPAGGFTDPPWSPSGHSAQKRELQDGERAVDSESSWPEYGESDHQLLSSRDAVERSSDLWSSHCCDHSGVQCDVRRSEESRTAALREAPCRGAETARDRRTPARLGRSQSRHCHVGRSLKRSGRVFGVMRNYRANNGSVKRPREKLNLLQLQVELLGEKDDHNTKAMNVHEQQSAPLMIEMPGNPNCLMNTVWLNSEGENYSSLQLRYDPVQKDFHLSISSQSFITEIFYFHKSISGNQKGNGILSWYQILQCKNQIGTQNLITRSINVNIKSGILNKCLQTTVSEHLNIVFKINIPYLFDNFYSLTRIENDSELGEGYIFKWIMHLNYLKLIAVKGHTVYLMRVLTFSKLLGDIMKPMLKERRPIFKTQQIFEGPKKENFDSFSTTTKNLCLTIFETSEKILFLMDIDDMEELSLIKGSHYKSISRLEQLSNGETWGHCSFSIVKTHMKSGPQFTRKKHGYISGKYHEINMHNQDLGTERKQDPKKVSSFTFKHTFEGSFNVRPQAILANQNTIHVVIQINRMTISQVLNFENFQNEIEGIKYDYVLKKEVKLIAQSSKYSCQVCIKIEKEEDRFFPKDGMLSVQSISLISKRVNVEETKSVSQNSTTDKNEYKSILQESELANSEHFHRKNEATLYVNHQFETDSNEGNNECFQNLTEECLSTETMTVVKDFEMKSKFDLVLEELRMFHEISKENEIPTTVETNNGQQNYFEESSDAKEAKMAIEKDLKMVTADRKCASPLPCDTIVGPSIHRRHQSLFKWKTVPNNGEQEVPNVYCCPRTPEEEILYFTSEQDGKNTLPKRPALFPDECMEEKLYYLLRGGSHFPRGISRIQPLKTCNRPIRIGLSRKARFKQLHPYLK
ncbi:RAD51-associated protein 2, partial [Heterocephalus glaber]